MAQSGCRIVSHKCLPMTGFEQSAANTERAFQEKIRPSVGRNSEYPLEKKATRGHGLLFSKETDGFGIDPQDEQP